MFALNNLGEYEARLGNITFVCDNADTGAEIIANAIAECYKDKLRDIAAFMLSEGIEEYFGDVSESDIIKNLGAPIISLDRNTVTYPDNGFDDMLIIEFHYNGLLDEFSGLDIDG
ncbi:MAG: hypothetical protein ACI4JN_08115 [Ruminococcus sp.]